MESAAYYPAMDDPAFMGHFKIDATYRRSAHVQAAYWSPGYKAGWEARPPLPYEAKKPAVAYLSSNCAAPSGRDAIVGRLMEIFNASSTSSLRVDGLGACRRTSDAAAGFARMAAGDLLRTYRFCIAIENSVAPDYVSEKVYGALAAGCTPIYLGAADIGAFIPAPSAVIDYRALGGTPEALAAELVRLNGDPAAYAEHHAWRALPPAGWSPAFRRLVARGSMEHTQCQICRRAAMHRAQWKAGVVGSGSGGGGGGGGGGVGKTVVAGVGGGGATDPAAGDDAQER
jgi:alpha-1,3-fucosyltransferase 10